MSQKKISQDDQWRMWASRSQQGDKNAYRSLLKELTPYIYNSVIAGLANPDWADDIVQDVLISVHKSLHTYSPERPFRPWLRALIGFRRADFLRRHYRLRRHKQTSLDNPEFLHKHVTNSDYAGEYKDIENYLETLPEKQRTVFKMVKIWGYTAKEAAEKSGMSESAVKVSVHRTLKKLRGHLQ